jgi:hypothetical protein
MLIKFFSISHKKCKVIVIAVLFALMVSSISNINVNAFTITPSDINQSNAMLTFEKYFNQPGYSYWLSKEVFPNTIGTGSYSIYKSGTLICSKNLKTGIIIYQGLDATTAIQKVINLVDSNYGAVIIINEGVYDVRTITLSGKSNIKIIGNGNAVLKSNINGVNILWNSGSIGPAISLTKNAVVNDISVSVYSAVGLKVGDWVQLVSQDYFNPTYPSQLKGEIHQIKMINGNTITFTEPVWDSYNTVKATSVKKMTMFKNVFIENLSFQGTAAGDNCRGITFVDGYNVKIYNCRFTNLGDYAIWLTNCVYSEVHDCFATGSNIPGSGYGCCIADASSFIKVYNNKWVNCRHGFSVNAASGYGAVRFVDIYNNEATDSTSYGLDAHSTGTYIAFRNNIVTGFTYSGVESYSAGICTGASFTWIEGNTISGGLKSPSYGISYRGYPEEVYIINNTIRDLNGSQSHGIYLAGKLIVRGAIINNHIYSGVYGISLYSILPNQRLMIYGNTIRSSSYGIRFSSASRFAVVSNIIESSLKTLQINGSTDITYGNYIISNFHIY